MFLCRARILSSSHLAAKMFHLRFKQRFTFFDVQLLRFALLFPLISQVRLLSACPSSLSQNLWKDAKIKASAEASRRTALVWMRGAASSNEGARCRVYHGKPVVRGDREKCRLGWQLLLHLRPRDRR